MSDLNEFRKEIGEYSDEDIMLILADQRDLFSPEEIALLEEESRKRDTVSDGFDKERYIGQTLEKVAADNTAAEEKRIEAERQRYNAEMRRNEQNRINGKIEALRASGKKGFWEYRVLSLIDENGGFISPENLTFQLNELGLEGWRLVCAYSNELGHNSHSGGVFGISTGTNATIDQNILLFERYVRIS